MGELRSNRLARPTWTHTGIDRYAPGVQRSRRALPAHPWTTSSRRAGSKTEVVSRCGKKIARGLFRQAHFGKGLHSGSQHPVAAICQFFSHDPIGVADCKVGRDKTKGWLVAGRVLEEGKGSRMGVQHWRYNHAFSHSPHVW